MNTHNCPICGAAGTETMPFEEIVQINGLSYKVVLHSRYCSACTSEFAGLVESRFNKRAMVALKKRVEGLLTGKRVAEIRAKNHLTIEQAGAVFGGGPVAFCKYEQDDICQTVAMDKLLRMADKFPDVACELKHMAGLGSVASREAATTQFSRDRIEVSDDIDMSNYQYNPKPYRKAREEGTLYVKEI